MARTVLHLLRHPDDEIAGAAGDADGAARRRLARRQRSPAGSAARPSTSGGAPRSEEACRRAGFELAGLRPPLPLSAGDDSPPRRTRLVELLGQSCPTSLRRSCARRRRTTGTTRTSAWDALARARARRASGHGTAALALGRLGRSPVPDADRAVRPRAARAGPVRARRARLGAGAPAARPAARGARRLQRRRRRGAGARLGHRGRPVGRARRVARARSMLTPSGWQLGIVAALRPPTLLWPRRRRGRSGGG